MRRSLIECLEIRSLLSFSAWSVIGPAIAKVPTSAGQISSVSIIDFGSTVYTGPLNVKNTLDRIRANNGPDRSNDGGVYNNSNGALPSGHGTWYEFTVEPSGGTDRNFSSISFPGPMRIALATDGYTEFTGDHYSTWKLIYNPATGAPPTIGSFTISPTSVVTGTSATLSANNVTKTGGTISNVKFYRESNGTSGLQTASDLLVGTGTQSGSNWTISAATTGLAIGTYTYYAIATDSTNLTSAISSATLSVTAPVVPTIGSFSIAPTTVVAGATITLTAASVSEIGGTISSVKFYLETNGTSGLQIGADTLIGTGTQSGTTWTRTGVSTTGLSIGSHSYYAVATDTANVNSAASSAALSVVAQTPPAIGSFTINPSSVAVGSPATLIAGSVTEPGGTITGVNFYRESNGTSGLQIGSDTTVGAGTQSGSDWSIAASTTGLAVGSYTFYAVATDSFAVSSSVSSATLGVTNVSASGPVESWELSSQSNFGTQGLTTTILASGLTNSLGLTRGSGVTTTGTAAGSCWGGGNWSLTTGAAGISGNQFVTFGLTISAGYTASLSEIDLNYRRSSSGPSDGYWEYQLNGGAWTFIGDFAGQFSSTATGGVAITPVSLAGISTLQNLSAGAVVNFRLTPHAAGAAGGNWYISGLPSGNDLVVAGAVTPIATTGSIVGRTFEDRNGNGLFDATDVSLNGVGVYLDLDNSGTLNGTEPSTTTSGSGNYTFASVTAGTYKVRETIPTGDILTSPVGNNGSAVVSVNGTTTLNFGNFPIVFNGQNTADSFYVRGNGALTEIWVNSAPPTNPTYSIATALLPSLTFNGNAGADSLVVDYSLSDPTPAGGIAFAGGSESDTLDVRGAGSSDAVSLSSSAVTHGTASTGFSAIEAMNLSNASFTVTADLAGLSLNVTGANTNVLFNTSQAITTLTIGAGSRVQLDTIGTLVLDVTTLSIAGGPAAPTGQLDLTNNGLVVRTPGSVASIFQLLQAGQNGFDSNGLGNWNGNGIISSTARAENSALGVDVYAVGVIRNADLDDLLGVGSKYSTWMGTTVNGEDALVRFTYAGDASLDGTITIDDYNLIDAAASGLTSVQGWASGDFDLNGTITIDDYNAIDTGYLYQTDPL